MNRDDIIRMAREAKLSHEIGVFGYPYLPELERFAALVAAAEREECAKIVVKYAKANEESDIMATAFDHCAAAIRARGKK